MEWPDNGDLHRVLDFLREIYALRSVEEFASHTILTLPRLVPSEFTSYNEVNPKQRRITTAIEPDGIVSSDDLVALEKHMNQHPLITHFRRTGDSQTLKISDFLSRNQYHRLALYHEFYRKIRVEDQIAFILPAPPPLVIGITLNRSLRNFTERERMILNLLRPHLIGAYRNAEAFTELKATLEADRAVIVLTKSGQVKEITDKAAQWLMEYYGHALQPNGRLPEGLRQWIKEEEKLRGGTDSVPSPHKTLVVRRKEGQLVVRLVSGSTDILLILEKRGTATRPEALEELGLTRREAEVLTWVALGRTNKEIGDLLGLSRRTVQKHLEHIFEKLGVTTRTAAAGIAAHAD